MEITLQGKQYEIPASIQLLAIMSDLGFKDLGQASETEIRQSLNQNITAALSDLGFQYRLAKFLANSGIPPEIAKVDGPNDYYLAIGIDDFVGILNAFIAESTKSIERMQPDFADPRSSVPVAEGATPEGFAPSKRRPRATKKEIKT